ERIGAVDPVVEGNQAVQVARARGLGPGPGGEAEAVAEPPHPREDLERPFGAELVELEAHRLLEVPEIALDVLIAEEMMRRVAAPDEELGRDLVLDELEGREAEARLALGELVEAAHAFRREDAEEPPPERVDEERVAEPATVLAEELRRIAQH